MCQSAARAAASVLSAPGAAQRKSGEHRSARRPADRRARRASTPGTRRAGRRGRARRVRAATGPASGSCCATRRLRGVEQLDGGEAGLNQRGQRPGGRGEVGKQQQPVAACGCTGTVRKVASATKASVPSLPMTRWVSRSIGRVWSRKRVDAVAHGVLHRVQPADRRDRGGVAADPVAQPRQPGDGSRALGRAVGRRRRWHRCRSWCRWAGRGQPIRGFGRCSVPCRRPSRWSCWRRPRRWCRRSRWPDRGRACGRSGRAWC